MHKPRAAHLPAQTASACSPCPAARGRLQARPRPPPCHVGGGASRMLVPQAKPFHWPMHKGPSILSPLPCHQVLCAAPARSQPNHRAVQGRRHAMAARSPRPPRFCEQKSTSRLQADTQTAPKIRAHTPTTRNSQNKVGGMLLRPRQRNDRGQNFKCTARVPRRWAAPHRNTPHMPARAPPIGPPAHPALWPPHSARSLPTTPATLTRHPGTSRQAEEHPANKKKPSQPSGRCSCSAACMEHLRGLRNTRRAAPAPNKDHPMLAPRASARRLARRASVVVRRGTGHIYMAPGARTHCTDSADARRETSSLTPTARARRACGCAAAPAQQNWRGGGRGTLRSGRAAPKWTLA